MNHPQYSFKFIPFYQRYNGYDFKCIFNEARKGEDRYFKQTIGSEGGFNWEQSHHQQETFRTYGATVFSKTKMLRNVYLESNEYYYSNDYKKKVKVIEKFIN